jgi:glycerol-3-phosphate dehydrogenase
MHAKMRRYHLLNLLNLFDWCVMMCADSGDPSDLVLTCHNDTSRNRADPQSRYSLTETPNSTELIAKAKALLQLL